MAGRRRRLSHYGAAALTLGAGLAATAVLFISVSALEFGKMELSFQQRAGARAAAIERGLSDAVEVLNVTNQLFRTVQPVSREQFHSFTTPLLQRYPFIQAFNYHRVLSHAERPAFEAALQAHTPGLRITELTPEGLVTAPERPFYNVVEYLEPLQGNAAALGLNSGRNLQVRAAIDRILHTGRAASTEQLQLAQDPDQRNSFIMIMPVYQPGMPTSTRAERHAAWVGDTAAVIRTPHLVHTILQQTGLLGDESLGLSVYAGDPSEAGSLAYRRGPVPTPKHEHWLHRWLDFDYHSTDFRSFAVLGRTWHIRADDLPRPFLADHLGSLATLLGGLLFSALAAAFVHTLVQRSRRVQLLVDARTADLQRSNQRLAEDVASRKRTERALQESENRFRRLLALSSDWYWEQDTQFRFTHITGGFFEKGHVAKENFLGRTRWECTPDLYTSSTGRDHIQMVQGRLPFSNFEYAIVGHDGLTRWFNTSGEPVYDAQGEFKGYRGTGSEITERKEAEQRIQHIAHHDVLTGLPNRVLLQDRLQQAIAYANRSGLPMWVVLIDLDRFKFVNDSLGHKAGDQLLQTVASRLQSSVRESDTVARLSGDEFVAILSQYPDEQLSPAIIERVMAALAQPVLLEGKEFFVTCSIGVAVYDADGTPAQNLIEHADIAMYSAKKLGRNTFQFYRSAMNDEAQERLRIESALRNALERDEFVLHYQPQVDLQTGQIVGMEALLRWQHPELGMVPPARFISLAEETGLIVPIGAWVLRTACQQARALQDAGFPGLRMGVNLSARQFAQPELVSSIAAVLAETGLDPSLLELELTESLFMHDVAQGVNLLYELKSLGVALSIDDFGTGYSSLSYLRNFPIDVLKIDRSFVNDIATDADDAAIVVSVIALAHNLELRVIAEGVESEEQLEFLRRHGCDEFQGFYFSRPVEAAQLRQMLHEGKHLTNAAPRRLRA
ncbi:EAL domain-containing protein [Pseudoduganella sp. DS3]|uniref:EAL domain-containing protein n=1 Tax=Pseudoduganella guangdongensis TaxID=2692179 RepID=A0A6N9HEZ8_9BURK|nr:EAL domain-containing protein [Pseudoduganella guangdongensis]MYN02161.1 EAL domain-containing protein [Pseudoduganella guangdongensis]